jgi:hypothetical protein
MRASVFNQTSQNREFRETYPNFARLTRDAQEQLVRGWGVRQRQIRQERRAREEFERAEEALRNNTPGSSVTYSGLSDDRVEEVFNDLADTLNREGPSSFRLLNVNGRWFTINYENIDSILNSLANQSEGDDIESDSEISNLIVMNDFTLSVPKPRQARRGANQNRNGQAFLHLHKFQDPYMQGVLKTMGVYSTIDPKNYEVNCFIQALKQLVLLGEIELEQGVFDDLKSACITRRIPTAALTKIANRYNLTIIVRKVMVGKKIKYGKGAIQVELGMAEEHYFPYYKIELTHWAMKNYCQELAEMNQWWLKKNWTHRDRKRAHVSTTELMKFMLDTRETGSYERVWLEPMNLSSLGIYETHYQSQVVQDFTSLAFPEETVRPSHPPRHLDSGDSGDSGDRGCEEHDVEDEDTENNGKPERDLWKRIKLKRRQILTSSKLSEGSSILQRLDREFSKFGLGPEEQLGRLSKHVPPYRRIVFDFEATTDGDRHKAYMVSACDLGDEENVRTFRGRQCAQEFLDWVLDSTRATFTGDMVQHKKPVVQLIAHNITYDISFLLAFLCNVDLTERGTSVILGHGDYCLHQQWVRLEFKDSLKMISEPLANFAKMFNLRDENNQTFGKEIMPHTLYSTAFVEDQGFLASDSHLKSTFPELYDGMLANLLKWECLDKNESTPGRRMWDMEKYAQIYCERDVVVLSRGWSQFCKDTLEHCQEDPNFYPTIASLANGYLTTQGCYDGVYEVSGIVREFIVKCNVGGRVMTRDNQKVLYDSGTSLDDFDATSLYPAAMESQGYPKGPPKVWDESVDLWGDSVTAFFVRIKVLEVGKMYPFPITCLRTKDKGNLWTNDLEGKELFVDSCTLWQLVEFAQVRYVVVQGYYFNEGVNNQIQTSIRSLFNRRLELKALKNPGQLGIKLMMNAAFGTCGKKAVSTQVDYVPPDRLTNYVHNHHHFIKHFVILPNGTTRFELYKATNEHFNKQHISSLILSRSKLIMNKVMCLAHDLDVNIYYTDTDSMHIESSGIDKLAEVFEVKYGKKLIGKDLGQFHGDFDYGYARDTSGVLIRATNIQPGPDEPKAVWSAFLGKKTYCDRLWDGANIGWMIKIKGIPIHCIMQTCNSQFGGDPEKMFEHLYNNGSCTFELGKHGHPMFKTTKDHQMVTTSQDRTIKFILE